MEPLKTTGVVLRTTRAKNSSLALSVLTKDLGRISVWARGARNPKHPMHAAETVLSYSEFVLLKRGEMYLLTAVSPIRSFYHIREDVEKLAYGVYFADLAGLLFAEGTEAEEALRLLLNTLHYLETGEKSLRDLKMMFELRIRIAAGFAPYLDGCMHCGNENAAAFSPGEGGLLCEACSPLHPLAPEALMVLRAYAEKNLKTALDFSGEPVADILEPLCEQFVRHHTDTYPKTLEYLHRLRHMVNE